MTEFLAGTSEVNITPPAGAPLVGPMRPSTGVHDELHARALVLTDGVQQIALVCLDLVGLDFALADAIRAAIRQQTGIPSALLNCTHTHSAPFTVPWNILGWQWCQDEGQSWVREMADNVVAAVGRAAANLREVALRAGRAPVRVGSNRRLPTEHGIAMKPNPDGTIVPWVDVLRVDGADGDPIAILFSHAAHPVIVHGASTLISADYPGYAIKAVERRIGGGAKALFAQGCGANINGDPLRGGFDAAEAAGKRLAEAVVQASRESEPLAAAGLRFRSVTFALPFQDMPPIEECRREVGKAEEQLSQRMGTTEEDSCRNTLLCLRDLLGKVERGERQSLRFEIHALAVGDEWCLLAMPHEVFAEYQLQVERVSRFPRNMVWAYTNGCESYVPTDKDFELGGYEAAGFPHPRAALRYRHRIALRPGIERQINEQICGLLAAFGNSKAKEVG